MTEQLQIGEVPEPAPDVRPTSWSFAVGGQPVPWQRTNSFKGKRFTPKRTRDYQNDIATIASFRRPSGWPYRDPDAEFALTLRLFHGDRRRRDTDNCLKTVKDALNGIAYVDDYQIAEEHIYRALDRGNPRAEIELEVLT